jgi:hypothetical protein
VVDTSDSLVLELGRVHLVAALLVEPGLDKYEGKHCSLAARHVDSVATLETY